MRLVMMGTGSFAEPTFEALLTGRHPVVGLVTQPDRATGKARGSTRQARRGMKELAVERSVPVYQPESINTPEGVEKLKSWGPDLLVVAAYGQILSKDVLAVTPHGGINVHASLLPKYRGAAPIAWAIYHGDNETGVTIIKMSIYLDAGEMLAQEATRIGPDETAGELEARLAPLGAKLALGVIDRIEAGTATGMKQNKDLVSKAPKLTKEHGLIDWDRPAEAVCNQIRAMQPWPTAYTYLHRNYLHRGGRMPVRLIVFKASPFQWPVDPVLPAGAILDGSELEQILLVTAGQTRAGERSVVRVGELQPEGKKRMSAADFLRGYPVGQGDRLGAEKL
jgi:methionyl-tRNA formyltransferase